MWFRNLSLPLKFGLLTGLIFCAVLMLIIGGMRQLSALNDTVIVLDTNRIPSVQHLSMMRSAFADYRIYEYRHVISTEEREMAAIEALLAAERARFIAAEQAYMPLVSDPLEVTLFQEFKRNEQQYLAIHEKLMDLSRNNRNQEANQLLSGSATLLYDECRTSLQRVIAHNIRLATEITVKSRARQRLVAASAAGLVVFVLLIIFVVHFVAQRMITQPVQQLSYAMKQAEQGQYDGVLPAQSHDEIGALVGSYQSMVGSITHKSEEVQAQNEEIVRQQRIMEVQAQYLERANSSLRQNNVDLRQFMQREFLRIEELTRLKDTLVNIARTESLHNGNVSEAMHFITEQGALHLDVARVSIWLMRGGRGFIGKPSVMELELMDLYDKNAGAHSSTAWLSERDYPHYFSALETLNVIDATDALTDQRTKEFTEKYLKPLGINAMLDVPIRSGAIVIGVLCVEHIGGLRNWTLEEEIFARSLGNFVVIALDAQEKMRQRERLKDLNKELLLVNTDLQEKNLALQTAQDAAAQTLLYINHQNQLLEGKTHELINANREMAEKQNLMSEVNALLADAHKQLNAQNNLLKERAEETTIHLLSLKDENSALRFMHDELQQAYTEIQRQHMMLEQQSRHTSAMADEVQGKNELLLQANTELSQVYRELRRQNELLQEQAVRIEEANTELQEKNMMLTRIDQEKNDMLGIVAHDLRNPLSSIMLGAAFLKRLHNRGQLTGEDMLRHLTRIEDTSERMNTIISEMLDLNAIETGRLQINTVDLDCTGLVQVVADDFTKRAETKNITIQARTPVESVRLTTDGRIMRQIMDNLVSNAVKFSPLGKSVFLELRNDEYSVTFIVRDEGPGINVQDRAHLFQKFTRLSARPTGGEHSTGLGLSIVKKFVVALGGDIRCESAPESGQIGATFIVTFPLQASS
ncbi:MAG: HAMP domain-containing protein [Candidatus Kapaibacterium sp.]|nr:MAG: HAMP domain-containing protein [Candidatus Kapabacteria bacterium]